jgi:trehalose 6-phosphate synthase
MILVMRQTLRFVIGLVLGLALLTWITSVIVQRTTRNWFQKDVTLRAQLVVSGARQALSLHWNREDRKDLRAMLAEITRDERIPSAAACTTDLTMLASTPGFLKFSCEQVGTHVRQTADAPLQQWFPWHHTDSLPGGSVMVSAIPVEDGDKPLGFIILVQDLSYAERREEKTKQFVLLAFGFLAVAAAAITIPVARLSWRRWSDEIRRLARGEALQCPEFRPILRDVRELVDRIMVEKETELEGGAWTPQRLKLTLTRHLHGERIIIMANREPYVHDRKEDGSVKVVHPASGLATALEPVMRACSGIWVGHGSGSADRDVMDNKGRIRVPPGEESYFVRPVWLSEDEEAGYHYGLCFDQRLVVVKLTVVV